MLRALRNQTQSIFFKCFLVLLICGFALWGVGDLTGGSKEVPILTTKNEEVTIETILTELNRIKYSLPERPSIKEMVENGIYRNLLNKYEQELLLNAEANSLNLYVPLSIKTNTINKEKAFKNPLGKFSQQNFLKSLNNAGLSEAKYLNMIQTEANIKQLSMPFLLNDFYNEKIAKDLLDWQNQIRFIQYKVLNNIDKNEVQKPSEIVLKNYYKKYKAQYEIPKTRNIRYIEINPSNFEDFVTINDNQLNERYEIEKSNYIFEEKRELYQVTIQNKEQANNFVTKIREDSELFIKLANKNFKLSSDDINIGLIEKSDLPLKSATEVFNAKLGDIVGPIETEFGFKVYKILKIEPQKELSYNEAIKDIRKKLVKELSIEILFEKLDILEDLIAEGNNLDEIVRSKLLNINFKINKLDKVSKNGFVYSYKNEKKYINKNTDFIKSIWTTNINQVSDIIDFKNDTYALIEVLNEKEKELPNYNNVSSFVLNKWLENEVRKQTKIKIKKLIENKNYKFSKIIPIKRDDKYIGKLNNPNLVSNVFDIKNKDVNFFNLDKSVIAVRVINTETENYKFDKKIYQNTNKRLSESFFKDFYSLYIKNLAIKDNLKRNYKELEDYVTNIE